MSYPIFPTSPVPADMDRDIFWGESTTQYDSGKYQGGSPYSKPLYGYKFGLQNIPRTKQQSLHAFVNGRKTSVSPFLFMDPYDNRINGVICVRTGTAARSFFVVTSEGWAYIPASGTLLITSNLSGALTQGTHYSFNDETGVFSTHITPSSSDYWTASCAYFRKCHITSYQESSKIWNQFSGGISFKEIALP